MFSYSGILPPDSVHIQDVEQRSAFISWFPPESDFNCIDGYEVVWTNIKYPEETGSKIVSADTYSLAIGKLNKYYRLVQGFRETCLFTGQYNTEGYDTITDVL